MMLHLRILGTLQGGSPNKKNIRVPTPEELRERQIKKKLRELQKKKELQAAKAKKYKKNK